MATNPNSANWHADGLRWIASRLEALAMRLEREASGHFLPEPGQRPAEEYLYDVRFRMRSGLDGCGSRPYY